MRFFIRKDDFTWVPRIPGLILSMGLFYFAYEVHKLVNPMAPKSDLEWCEHDLYGQSVHPSYHCIFLGHHFYN